jgi:DnaJ like chaperone protein
MKEKNDSKASEDKTPQSEYQKKVFISTFSMIAKLASVDGKVTKDEVQLIEKFMESGLGLEHQRKAFAIQIFNEAKVSKEPFETFAKQYAELLEEKPKMLEWMIEVMIKISSIDGKLSESEEKLIRSASNIFLIPKEKLEQLIEKYLKAGVTLENSPYRVLLLKEGATDEEIESSYKKLCKEYSPSRIVELGLPQEFVELAETKFRQIQTAYKSILERRGIPHAS